jgi:sulfide:quinone oxidoreductase
MKTRFLILGAGFGGLELSTLLSEAFGADADVTLIDKSDAFIFGYSKLDVMFGRAPLDAVRLPYANFAKPGVRLLRQTILSIDPERRQVVTDGGTFEADYLIVALGAEYDLAATPGLAESGNEFYSVAGAAHLRDVLPTITGGNIVIGVCAAPFKCPPAPSECVLMLHDFLTERGVRQNCHLSIVIPFGRPVPPSPETSDALVAAFAERNITWVPQRRVASLDGARRAVVLDNGSEMPYDLFLGIPKHRAPAVVEASGLAENGWVPVNPRTLATKFPNVYAVGDIAATGTPKAGVFAEGSAKAVAEALIAEVRGSGDVRPYSGAGSCYIEFGGGRIGRVDVDFFSGPSPTGTYYAPSTALMADKKAFGSTRRARWFGLS